MYGCGVSIDVQANGVRKKKEFCDIMAKFVHFCEWI